jgi:hypothetical protein
MLVIMLFSSLLPRFCGALPLLSLQWVLRSPE